MSDWKKGKAALLFYLSIAVSTWAAAQIES